MSGHTTDKLPKATLTDALQEALARLHDPNYRTPDTLAALLGTANWDLARHELTRAIEELKPADDAPARSQAQRYWAILHGRYLQGQTQETVAEELSISVRHLRRQQGDAVQWLASRLQASPGAEGAIQEGAESSPWMAQVRQELESLRDEANSGASMVEQIIAKVVTLAEPLLAKRGVRIVHEPGAPDLMAGVPATSLRQVLLVTLDRMTDAQENTERGGVATLKAEGDDHHVRITIATRPPLTEERPCDYLVEEILASQGGHAEWHVDDDRAATVYHLHAVHPCRVLVVEDNADLVHFYRRFVAGTPYRIAHKADGADLVEAVRESAADIIVLDVMLPDIDGWELLTHLHQHPATRHIPTLVCSVVRAEELALSLGAAAYLAKPVRRAEFIQALDQLRCGQTASASD